MNKKILWITWEEQRRNKQIADSIGADFYQFTKTADYSRIARYLINLWHTLKTIARERPSHIIAQNPSVVLAFEAALLKYLFRYRVGIDTHNGGFALDSNSKFLKFMARWIQRHSDFTISHNNELKAIVELIGGDVIALPDKIPHIKEPKETLKLDGKYNLLYICTYAGDEPYREVIQAFEALGNDYHVYLTGNYRKGNLNPDDYGPNIHFTGKIPWDEYDQMLYSCDATLDLTKRNNCLLCGAYESVAANKPMVLTDTLALRNYFYKGAQYTDNSPESIASCVKSLMDGFSTFKEESAALKEELNGAWDTVLIKRLKDKL